MSLKMFLYLKLIVFLFVLGYNNAAIRLPPSPCPQLFDYEGDVESDRWYGVITFSSSVELMSLNYKVQLDRPSELLVSWDGIVNSNDNLNYNVFNPYHRQRAGQKVNARIMVKFNPNNGIPAVIRIVINGNVMCDANQDNRGGSVVGIGLSGESTTERFDPSFNEEDDPALEFTNKRDQPDSSNKPHSSVYNNVLNHGTSASNYGGSNPSYTEQNSGSDNGAFANTNSGFSTSNVADNNSNRFPIYVSPVETANNNINNVAKKNNLNNDVNRAPNANSNRPQWSDLPSDSVNKNNPNFGIQSIPNSVDRAATSGNSRPQLSEESDGSHNNNHASSTNFNGQNGYNGGTFKPDSRITNQPSGTNNESIVTTLTFPGNLQNNKSNDIDQIVQLIKNQLEQQQFSANKTVILAVVNSPSSSTANSISAVSSSITVPEQTIPSRSSINPSIFNTSTVASINKLKVFTSTTKQSNGFKPT